MNNDFGGRSIGQAMPLAPREVVVVLEIEHHIHTQVANHDSPR
jgi:hypothetical protein